MPSGDAKFTEIYTRYGKQIQAYCARRIDRSKVADAVAETFLVAWRAAGSDRGCRCCAAVALRHGPTRSSVINGGARPGRGPWRGVSGMSSLSTQRATDAAVVVRQEQTDLVLLATSSLKAIDQEVLRLELRMSHVSRSRSPRHHARSGETAGVSRGATWRGVREVGGDGWTPAVGRRRCMSVEEQVVALFVAANPVRIQTCSSRSPLSTTSIRHRAGVTGLAYIQARAVCRLVPSGRARHCGSRCRGDRHPGAGLPAGWS